MPSRPFVMRLRTTLLRVNSKVANTFHHEGVTHHEYPSGCGSALTDGTGSHSLALVLNPVGKVDEFALDPQTGKITFLVLKEGHLLKHDVPVPVDQIDRFGEETIFLKLTKAGVEQLSHE